MSMIDKISEGEDFIVRQRSRTFNSATVDAFKIDGTTAQVSMAKAPSINGVTQLVITGMVQKIIAGTNASVTAQSIVLAGVSVGDKVISVFDTTAAPAADVSTDFESTISVAGHIKQTSVNLSASTAILVTVLKLS